MRVPDWLKKMGFWVFHLLGWIFLNIILGSLPFVITLFREETANPFLVGLLCFCFTTVSSGLYLFLVNSLREGVSGLEKGLNIFLQSFAVLWVIVVWTIVLGLKDILKLIGNEPYFDGLTLFLYLFSVILFLAANLKNLSSLVNEHVSKYLLLEPSSNSKADGASMKASLKSEGGL